MTLEPSLLRNELQHLSEQNLIEKAGELYHLTHKGRVEADEAKKREETAHKYLSSGTAAAKVSMSTNILLAVLKLSVGVLPNSKGLISDGFDASTDIIGSAAVYVGTKHKKQILSTLLVVDLMLVGGVALGYEGITRLIKPEPVEAGLLSMLAGLASGIIAYMMGIYLGFVGKRTGNLSMVSQSLDSKNHVIIPTAVVVGIAFAAFGLSIVDSLVSVCVVTLILKSVEEIGAETYKSARGEEPNLSRFKAKWKTKVDNYRRGYIKFLTLLRLKTPMSIEELARELETTFSRKGDSYLKNSALNMREGFSFKKSGRIRLKELVDQGLIMLEDGKYHTTRKGNGRLRERLRQEKHKHQKS